MIDKVEHKYYGKYRGIVVDSKDPLNLGRLKLKVPSILGKDEVTGWALPCVPFGGAKDQGFFFIPEKDASVWVEFEAGDLQYPIWVGTFWRKLDGNTEVPSPADSQKPPTRKIIRTKKGSSIEIEDKDSEEVFIIKYNDGSKTNTITMDKNGIVISDAYQNKIEMNATAINIFPASQCNLGSRAINLVNNLPACLFTGALHSIDSGHAKISK